MKKLSNLMFILILQISLFSQTIVPGGNVSGIWGSSGSPYLIHGDIYIQNGSTLNIEPGVEIIFQDHYTFEVSGNLNALGSLSDSIKFTVADTTGYSTGSHIGWGGIYAYDDITNLNFNFCIIEFSKSAGIYIDGINSITLDNSHLRYSHYGLEIMDVSFQFSHLKCTNNNVGFHVYNMDESGSLDYFNICNNKLTGISIGGVQGSGFSASHGIVIGNGNVGISVGSWDDNFASFSDVLIEGNGNVNSSGGGLVTNSNVSLTNVIIRNNIALKGGGIFGNGEGYVGNLLALNLNNCIIENNISIEKGGGIYFIGRHLGLYNSIIRNNKAADGGGAYIDLYTAPGMYTPNSTISGVIFSNNEASNDGGGLYYKLYSVDYGTYLSKLKNIQISENKANNNGGGLYLEVNNQYGPRDFSTITIANNRAGNSGSGIFHTANYPTIELKNLIVWNNPGNEITDVNNTLSITYSDIMNSWPGLGNINSDPHFMDSENSNYHLNWINYPLNDYTKSPCIDSGDPATNDPDGTPADMGAYFFNQAAQNLVSLDATAFLEGPFAGNQMIPTLNAQGNLPLEQPYGIQPWSHFGQESVTTIPNSTIIDWVFIEIRKLYNPSEPKSHYSVSRQAAFLLNNGSIRALDGTSLLNFYTAENDSLYLCIYHRNHLPVISSNPITIGANPVVYNFSTSPEMAMGGMQSQNMLAPGKWGMIASDGNSDAQINNLDKDDSWYEQYENSGYYFADFDMNASVNELDLQKWELNAGKGNSRLYDYTAFNCGSVFLDERDGQNYTTVQIGNQCWMAENLNIGIHNTNSQGQNPTNGIIEKYCYDNLPINCDVYGGIYLWDELMQNSTDTASQGICPAGWRIPTDFDWKVLEGTVDSQYGVGDPEWDGTWTRGFDVGLNLKSTSGWLNNLNGLDLFGFNSLPGGDWDFNNGMFNYLHEYSCYYTSSQEDLNTSWGRVFIFDYNTSIRGNYNKGFGASVRCIRQ